MHPLPRIAWLMVLGQRHINQNSMAAVLVQVRSVCSPPEIRLISSRHYDFTSSEDRLRGFDTMADKNTTASAGADVRDSTRTSLQRSSVRTISPPKSGNALAPAQNSGTTPAQDVSDETPEDLNIEAVV